MTKPHPAPSLLDTVVCARERLNDASRVAIYLKEQLLSLESGLTVDEVAGLILGPYELDDPGHGREVHRPKAVCVPVRHVQPQRSVELRLLTAPWESEVGIVVHNRLVGKRVRFPGITLDPYPEVAAPLASAWEPEPDHLGELVREHRLRGVILGVQSVENLGHAIAYDDEPLLLTLTDVLDGRSQLNPAERKARPVVWSDLPCVKLVSRH